MTDNDQFLQQIRKVVREEVKAETEPLKQGQAQIKTVVEALEAGQKDIREELAMKSDKSDIQDLKAEVVKKIKDHETRIDELEKEVGLPHPHKH